jgi:hypothetical protein
MGDFRLIVGGPDLSGGYIITGGRGQPVSYEGGVLNPAIADFEARPDGLLYPIPNLLGALGPGGVLKVETHINKDAGVFLPWAPLEASFGPDLAQGGRVMPLPNSPTGETYPDGDPRGPQPPPELPPASPQEAAPAAGAAHATAPPTESNDHTTGGSPSPMATAGVATGVIVLVGAFLIVVALAGGKA